MDGEIAETCMRTWRTKRYRYWSSHTIELHTAVATLFHMFAVRHTHIYIYIYSYHLYKPTFRLFMVGVNCGDFWWFCPTFWLFVYPFYSEAEWEPKALVLWALKACGSGWGLTRLDSKHGDWVPGFLWYSIFGVEQSIANYFEVIFVYILYIDICMDILTSIFWSENMCARLWSMTKWRLHMRYSRENCMLHVHIYIYILKYYILFILYTLYIYYILYYILYIYVNIYIYLWSVFWSAWPCNCGHLLATVHTKLFTTSRMNYKNDQWSLVKCGTRNQKPQPIQHVLATNLFQQIAWQSSDFAKFNSTCSHMFTSHKMIKSVSIWAISLPWVASTQRVVAPGQAR
jgi:hypothetical protein